MVAARLAKMMEKEAVKWKGRYRQNPADLQGFDLGESRVKAAGQVNVSPRLTFYAIKVLQNGSRELIAAVESGALAVTPGRRCSPDCRASPGCVGCNALSESVSEIASRRLRRRVS